MNRLELAISSIKCQIFDKIYPIMKAFKRGTILEELEFQSGEIRR